MLYKTQQQHSFVTTTDGAFVCVCMCVRSCTVCFINVFAVIGHRHTDRSRIAVDVLFAKQPLRFAATKPLYLVECIQCFSSSTAAAVSYKRNQPCSKPSRLCTSHGVCVWLVHSAQQQKIEPRQHFYVQRDDEPHIVGHHTRYTKHGAGKKLNISYHWNACSLFPTWYAPSISSKSFLEGEPCMTHNTIQCSNYYVVWYRGVPGLRASRQASVTAFISSLASHFEVFGIGVAIMKIE